MSDKPLKAARSKAEIARTIFSGLQLVIAIVTLIIILSR